MTEEKAERIQVPKLQQITLHSELTKFESCSDSLRVKSASTDRAHNSRQSSFNHGLKVSPRLHKLKEATRISPTITTDFQASEDMGYFYRRSTDFKKSSAIELTHAPLKDRDITVKKPLIIPQMKHKDIFQKNWPKSEIPIEDNSRREGISSRYNRNASSENPKVLYQNSENPPKSDFSYDPTAFIKAPSNDPVRVLSMSSNKENRSVTSKDSVSSKASNSNLSSYPREFAVNGGISNGIENKTLHLACNHSIGAECLTEPTQMTSINGLKYQHIAFNGKENLRLDDGCQSDDNFITSCDYTDKRVIKHPKNISGDFQKCFQPSLKLNLNFLNEYKYSMPLVNSDKMPNQNSLSTLDTIHQITLSHRSLKTDSLENIISRITVEDRATTNSNDMKKQIPGILKNCIDSKDQKEQNSTKFSDYRSVIKFDKEFGEHDSEAYLNENRSITLNDLLCCPTQDPERLNDQIQNTNCLKQLQTLQEINLGYKNIIEKLKIQNTTQEMEIQFLKQTKERLENNLKGLAHVNANPEFQTKKLEMLLEEREKQLKELSLSLQMANKELQNLQKSYKNEKRFQDEILLKLQQKNQQLEAEMNVIQIKESLDHFEKMKKDYPIIEQQIQELETMQNILVDENNTLKKLNEGLKQENNILILKSSLETKRPAEGQGKNPFTASDALLEVLEASYKLDDIEDFSSKLVQIVKPILKGEEPPIELILKHNRTSQGKRMLESQQVEHKKKDFVQIIRAIALTINKIYKSNQTCMDAICDLYATKYGNNCSIQ